MKIEVIPGGNGRYDMIWVSLSNLKTTSIHYVYTEEQELVMKCIYGFVVGVESLKRMLAAPK